MKQHRQRNNRYIFLALVLGLLLTSCGPNIPDEIALEYKNLPSKLDYNLHVKPILSDRCFVCHGNDKEKLKADLRMTDHESATSELKQNPGKFAIVPGNLEKSEFYHRIISTDPNLLMPPPDFNVPLSDKDKAILIKWIEEGAKYKPHWAFEKPEKSKIPRIKHNDWPSNNIDHYILAKLEEQSWEPSPEADRQTLLRRVTFDLTGLPPTLEELDAFQNDKSEDAYEKVVDRLLSSAAYAERMTTDWMDLSRFADTHGYTVDRFRDMSPWRDWVIDAFRKNMAYDTFVTWQLAGDLLPNPTKEQILATGFNRNHQQNMEGGIVDEEFRVEYVADRANTVGTAFLGLTLECARCHDHKYDPISQKEYFETFSFFNNVKEAGQISWNNAMPGPTLLLTDEKIDSVKVFLEEGVQTHALRTANLKLEAESKFEEWIEKDKFLTALKGIPQNGLIAQFDFNKSSLVNKLNTKESGRMTQMYSKPNELKENYVKGRFGKGMELDGDAWIDFGDIGVFDKANSFSVGMWVKIPEELENGVFFHKGKGAALHNFRGYHLALNNNRLEMLMAHTAPYNAILEIGPNPPRNKWIHLMMTYNGTSEAEGLELFLNGEKQKTEIETDNLFKDILFHFPSEPEPGLQVGARWRGFGIKGALVDDILVYDRCLSSIEVLAIGNYEKARQQITDLKVDDNELIEDLKELYFSIDQGVAVSEKDLEVQRRSLNSFLDTIPEIMVMEEMESPRKSYVHLRGRYDDPGEEVFPSTIEAVLAFDEGLPKNRLGLSRWLFDKENPLTARVAVNRLWAQIFGRGLVKTIDDFGNQGDMPSHPELLDMLALEFQADWDVRSMLKKMVMSSTYKQSSVIQTDKLLVDGENILYWRGPSTRLSAEMLRDNALAASGLLVNRLGGKSVKPYQPEGLWNINGGKYDQGSGEDLYRRSLYSFWKRTVPLPTQSTFDAPTRSICTVKRQKTSTPLQALVLLNDPTFIEAAKVMGENISKSGNTRIAIHNTFLSLTGRSPSEGELDVLMELRNNEQKKFSSFPEKMSGWLSAGEYNLDTDLEMSELAANTVVASAIINADATIVKR